MQRWSGRCCISPAGTLGRTNLKERGHGNGLAFLFSATLLSAFDAALGADPVGRVGGAAATGEGYLVCSLSGPWRCWRRCVEIRRLRRRLRRRRATAALVTALRGWALLTRRRACHTGAAVRSAGSGGCGAAFRAWWSLCAASALWRPTHRTIEAHRRLRAELLAASAWVRWRALAAGVGGLFLRLAAPLQATDDHVSVCMWRFLRTACSASLAERVTHAADGSKASLGAASRTGASPAGVRLGYDCGALAEVQCGEEAPCWQGSVECGGPLGSPPVPCGEGAGDAEVGALGLQRLATSEALGAPHRRREAAEAGRLGPALGRVATLGAAWLAWRALALRRRASAWRRAAACALAGPRRRFLEGGAGAAPEAESAERAEALRAVLAEWRAALRSGRRRAAAARLLVVLEAPRARRRPQTPAAVPQQCA